MRSFSLIPVPPRAGLSPGDIGPRNFANRSTFPTGTKLVADGALTQTRFVNLSIFGTATRLTAGVADGEFIQTRFANVSTFGASELVAAPADSSFRLPPFTNVSTFGSETALSVAPADGSFRLTPFTNTSTFGAATILDRDNTGVGLSVGTSTATGVAVALVESVGTSAGSSTAASVSAATVAAVGTSAGTSTAAGLAVGVAAAAGSSAGTSTAAGVGAGFSKGAGTSAGGSTAVGVSPAPVITLIAHTKGQVTSTGTNASVTTAAIDTTGADFIVIVGSGQTYPNFYTPSDSKGNTYTPLEYIGAARLYYCANPTVGTGHTFNFQAPYGAAGAVAAFAGVATVNPFDQQAAGANGSLSSILCGNLTPRINNELIIYGLGGTENTTVSIFGGLNPSIIVVEQAPSNADANGIALAYEIQTAATTRNGTFSWTGNASTCAVAAAFSPTPMSIQDSVGLSAGNSTATAVGLPVPAPTIRGTVIQSGYASSYTVAFPTGSVAGDLALIFFEHAYGLASTPTGWTLLDNQSGSYANGAVLSKVLTSGDISTGTVVVSAGGSYDGSVACITFHGATSGITGLTSVRVGGSGSTSVTLTSPAYMPNSMGVYFGGNRAASTDTCNQGANLRQTNDGSAASACLYAGTPTGTQNSATWSFSSAGSGYYCVMLYVMGP